MPLATSDRCTSRLLLAQTYAETLTAPCFAWAHTKLADWSFGSGTALLAFVVLGGVIPKVRLALGDLPAVWAPPDVLAQAAARMRAPYTAAGLRRLALAQAVQAVVLVACAAWVARHLLAQR